MTASYYRPLWKQLEGRHGPEKGRSHVVTSKTLSHHCWHCFKKKFIWLFLREKNRQKHGKRKENNETKFPSIAKETKMGQNASKKKHIVFGQILKKKKEQNHQFWSRSINFPVKTIKLCLDMVQRWKKGNYLTWKKNFSHNPQLHFSLILKHTHTHTSSLGLF